MLSFGGNSFWNFMYSSPVIQDLLNKPDLKLEELLDEDEFQTQLKSLNQKLLNFLLREESFKELISYVINVIPVEEGQNEKKAYKYPFVCADVLSSDSQALVSEFFKTKQDLNETKAIHKAEEAEDQDEVNTEDQEDISLEEESGEKPAPADKVIENEEKSTEEKTPQAETEKGESADSKEFPYLDYLFSFLEPAEMNLTSAGYFAKIVNNLFAKKPTQLITYIYEHQPGLLDKMIRHIYSKSIAEFVAKILTFDSSTPRNSDEIYNTKRNEVIKQIIKKLDPKSDIEEINNTAYLICEILGKYSSMHCSQEILQNLLEKPTIDYFFEILKAQESTSSCAIALILGNIFAYYILIGTSKSSQDDSFEEPIKTELTEEIPLVAAFISNLESIISYICNTTGESFNSQYGAKVVPFGSARLKIIELIIIAMKANNKTIYSKLIEYRLFDGLLNLIQQYEWNNLLHNQIEKIITIFLESNYDDLKAILFEDVKLLNFVIKLGSEEEYTLPGPHARKIVRGYKGQITNFANKLVASADPLVQKYTSESEEWREFVNTTLSDINRKNNADLGGDNPRRRNDSEELDSNKMIEKFSKYFNAGNNGSYTPGEGDNDDDEDEEDQPYGYDKPDNENDNENDNDDYDSGDEKEAGGYDLEVDRDDDRKRDWSILRVMNSPVKINESLKTEEEVLIPEFSSNAVFKKQDMHSVDDVLKELGIN